MKISPDQWLQASLPVSFGGLGIRSLKSLSLPAFLSSFSLNEKLIKMMLRKDDLNDQCFNDASVIWKDLCLINTPTSCQADWDIPLVRKEVRELISKAEGKDKIRLKIISDNHGGSEWLNAIPIPSLGLYLSDDDMRVNVALRLGAPTVELHNCASCHALVDTSGTHGLSCRASKGRFSRHSEANGIISRALCSAGFPSVLEPTGLSRDDGRRPDGATTIPWKRGLALTWDFTCADSFAPSRIEKMVTNASDERETIKIKMYEGISHHHIFEPVSTESLGVWGKSTIKFLKEIGKLLIAKTGETRAGYFFRQRLSVAVARGNTSSVLGTLPYVNELDFPY